MKPVEKISIGGYAFNMEVDAVAVTRQYLGSLSAYYRSARGGEEIMEGIEERMAELLEERCGVGDKTRIISRDDIDAVVNILGKPEDIENEADGSESRQGAGSVGDGSYGSGTERSWDDRADGKKKLYRDIDHKKIMGVCSGLGIYLNFDVTVLRLLFVVCGLWIGFWLQNAFGGLYFMIPVLAYLVLGICMPAARTVTEKHELRGEGNTVKDIQRDVEKSFDKMAEGAGEMADSVEKSVKEMAEGAEQMVNKAAEGAGQVADGVKEMTGRAADGMERSARKASGAIRGAARAVDDSGIGRFILVCIGIVVLLTGIGGIFGGTLALFTDTVFGSDSIISYSFLRLSEWWPELYSVTGLLWVKSLMCVAYFLPFIWLIYIGLQLIIDFRSPRWHPGLVMFILWLIVVLCLSIVLIVGLTSAQIEFFL